MKIVSTQLMMQGGHQHVEIEEEKEQLSIWSGEQRPDGNRQQGQAAGVVLQISDEAIARQPQRVEVPAEEISSASPQDQIKMMILSRLYTQITGQTMEVVSADEIINEDEIAEMAQATNGIAERSSINLQYDYSYRHYEYEKSTFSAQGVVKTADGKEIDFSVELSMSREFLEQRNISIRHSSDVQVKDPLVINYSGQAARLSEQKFSFDLDSDGRREQISFVQPGSGFLVADFNRDGVANNGGELFGPKTGDGFRELAMHDDDGNGWIDEADSIYDSLRIWSKSDDGQDQLMALGHVGVGAIYLGNIETPFDHKGANNQLLGEVVSSSVYLSDEGDVGTVQQINLVV